MHETPKNLSLIDVSSGPKFFWSHGNDASWTINNRCHTLAEVTWLHVGGMLYQILMMSLCIFFIANELKCCHPYIIIVSCCEADIVDVNGVIKSFINYKLHLHPSNYRTVHRNRVSKISCHVLVRRQSIISTSVVDVVVPQPNFSDTCHM